MVSRIVVYKEVPTELGDRVDYTSMISKVVMATSGLGQQGYWATTTLTIDAGQGIWFTVEKGFDPNYEYIPEGKGFYLDEYTVSASDNVLLTIAVGVQSVDSQTVKAIGYAFGFGQASLTPRRGYRFDPNTRPVYYIKNNGSSSITVNINIYGSLEPLI